MASPSVDPMSLTDLSHVVLARRTSRKGKVEWLAGKSADCDRLEVVGIVAASAESTVIEPVTEAELRERLDGVLSSVERVLVAALVSAIVKELQSAQPPLQHPAA